MPRGSQPGERRGGRQVGVPNKVKREVSELARQYTTQALKALAAALENPKERVAAAVALLDRGYGKPSQTLNATVKRIVDADSIPDGELAHIATGGGAGIAEAPDDPTQLH